MHEVSLIGSVVAIVEQERHKQAFGRVTAIRLQVGALGCADPAALSFCFDAVTRGTIVEGARLEIETVAGVGWCDRCQASVPLEERFDACPVCESHGVRMTAGDVLRLAEMEVE